jgi:hypothetical protein
MYSYVIAWECKHSGVKGQILVGPLMLTKESLGNPKPIRRYVEAVVRETSTRLSGTDFNWITRLVVSVMLDMTASGDDQIQKGIKFLGRGLEYAVITSATETN